MDSDDQEEPKDLVEASAQPRTRSLGKKLVFNLLLPVLLLAVGWFAYDKLATPPERAKRPPGKPRSLKSRAVELKVENYPSVIRTQGKVLPHNEVTLNSQVAGRVVRVDPSFEDGSFFSKGDVLVELDSVDLAGAVVSAKAQLARATSAHAQEQTRARQAKLNWEDLGYEEEPNELVLRLPQLREAEAGVDSAQAQLQRAQRDLERAVFKAPFNGRVRTRQVGVGQTVGAGTPLGTVFSSEFAEVRLPVSADDLALLDLPQGPEDTPIEVELLDALNKGNQTKWKASILRTEGVLDEDSLNLFAIARIYDPFGRQSSQPGLLVGQPVIGLIPGKLLENVVAVPRTAVRQLDRIYLIDKTELTLRSLKVKPVWSNEEFVIVREPSIEDGTLLATSHLVYAPEGSKVEILPDLGTDSDSAGSSDKLAGKEKKD